MKYPVRRTSAALHFGQKVSSYSSTCPGRFPGVDEVQPGLATDLGGPQQAARRGVVRVGHPVVLVEGGHVPGDVRRDPGQEAGRLPQLVGAVVETGTTSVTTSTHSPRARARWMVSRTFFSTPPSWR